MELNYRGLVRAHMQMMILDRAACGCDNVHSLGTFHEYQKSRLCPVDDEERGRFGVFCNFRCLTGQCVDCGFDSSRHMCHCADKTVLEAASTKCLVWAEEYEKVLKPTRVCY